MMFHFGSIVWIILIGIIIYLVLSRQGKGGGGCSCGQEKDGKGEAKKLSCCEKGETDI